MTTARPLLLAGWVFAACTGPAAEHVSDRVVRPVHSAERIVADELAPEQVGRSVRHMTDQTVMLFGDVAAPARSTRAALYAVPGELQRFGSMRRDGGELAAKELSRLRPPPGWVYSEFARVGKLGADPVGHMTELLGLDRHLMGESRDRQHRTDPDDTAPEPSWSERLARRIFP